MKPWENPADLGRRIAAARAYVNEGQETFAKRLGKSGKTLAKMEQGDIAALGRPTVIREQLVRRLIDSGCPPEIFGLQDEGAVSRNGQDLEELRRAVGALVILETTKDLPDEARQLLEIELAAARRWSSIDQNFGEPGSAAQNG